MFIEIIKVCVYTEKLFILEFVFQVVYVFVVEVFV